MTGAELEKLKRIVLLQQKQIKDLTSRVDDLDGNAVQEPVEEVQEPITKSHGNKVENPTNLFRVFGIVGVILILLGMVYFYKYAVDQGWIGITGRIALGVIAAFIFIGIGFVLYSKEFIKYSQFLFAGGLGILYFTIFATYHFEDYRQALGMNLVLNTILLLTVMVGGLLIGLRLDQKNIVYWSLVLGFAAAFLSGISGKTLHILIYVLLVDIIIFIIAKIRGWYVGIPAQVLTYIAFAIWFVQGISSPTSLLAQTSQPLLITFLFLGFYYIIFTAISFVQASDHKEGECLAMSVINAVCLGGFGLGLINHFYPEFNGLWLMIVAGITLFVGFLSRNFNFEKIFDIHFLLTFVFIGIAVPVQFDNSVVTILWAIMSIGLTYAGIKAHHNALFFTGYFGYIIPLARVFFYDMWFLDDAERLIAVGVVLFGILIIQRIRKLATEQHLIGYTITGIVLFGVWGVREIVEIYNDEMALLMVSLFWAVYAIGLIIYGIMNHNKVFSRAGVIMFGIVIAKVVALDIGELPNIYRVVGLFFVGILALVGSFIFVRNKEKIKEYI